MSASSTPIKADWVKDLECEAALGRKLVAILSKHCRENEGAVQTLNRIIRERSDSPTTRKIP